MNIWFRINLYKITPSSISLRINLYEITPSLISLWVALTKGTENVWLLHYNHILICKSISSVCFVHWLCCCTKAESHSFWHSIFCIVEKSERREETWQVTYWVEVIWPWVELNIHSEKFKSSESLKYTIWVLISKLCS